MKLPRLPVVKARERLAELNAARSGRHATQARAIPVDLAVRQDQAGRSFRFGQLNCAGFLVVLLCGEYDPIFTVFLAVRHAVSVLRCLVRPPQNVSTKASKQLDTALT